MSETDPIALHILAVLSDHEELTRLQSVLSGFGDIVEGFTDLGEAARAIDRGAQLDLAFIDVMAGDHAGLALVHHVSAMTPACEIYALVPEKALASGSQALSLGAKGLFSLPLTGDELLTAATNVRTRRTESAQLTQARRENAILRKVTEACSRLASVVGGNMIPTTIGAAQAIAEILGDELDAREVAIYLDPRATSGQLSSPPIGASIPPASPHGTRPDGRSVLPPPAAPMWNRVALVIPENPEGPITKRGAEDEPWLDEIEGLLAAERIAQRRGLSAIPLEAATVRGVLLIGGGKSNLDARSAFLLHAIAAQSVTALRLAAERERTAREITVKDPATSAYTFGYFVDVAGREIDRARRFGRRFALVSVIHNTSPANPRASLRTQVELVESLLSVVSDLDVVAYLDESEGELGVLLPETDGISAYRLVRSMLKMVRSRSGLHGVQIGAATFPHDGTGLSQLLRCARRRAEATRASCVRRLGLEDLALPEILDALLWDPPVSLGSPSEFDQPRALDLPSQDVVGLTQALITQASRAGRPTVMLLRREGGGLAGALSSMPRDELNLIDATPPHAIDADIDAAILIAQHAVYTLVGRDERGFFRGVHAGDPVLADLVAERLGL